MTPQQYVTDQKWTEEQIVQVGRHGLSMAMAEDLRVNEGTPTPLALQRWCAAQIKPPPARVNPLTFSIKTKRLPDLNTDLLLVQDSAGLNVYLAIPKCDPSTTHFPPGSRLLGTMSGFGARNKLQNKIKTIATWPSRVVRLIGQDVRLMFQPPETKKG